MKTLVCPISSEKMPEHLARLNALFVVLTLVIYLFSMNLLFVLFLLVDFFLRGFLNGKFSPISTLSKFISASISLKSGLVDKAPKVFAARLGFLFSLTLVLLALFNLSVIAAIVAGVFAFCALLEVVFSFCVGCYIYTYIVLPFNAFSRAN